MNCKLYLKNYYLEFNFLKVLAKLCASSRGNTWGASVILLYWA